MATCDICAAEMGFAEALALSIDDLQELIRRGFGPSDKVVRLAMSAGWTREQVIARWQQELDARPRPYWMLCPACAKWANKFMPAEEAPAPGGEAAPEAPAAGVSPIQPGGGETPAAEEPPVAAAGLEEEEEAEIEEEPWPAGKRPPLGRTLLIGLLIGLLGGVAFSLLVLDRTLHPVTPTPIPTVVVVPPTATIAPTRVLPTRRPATLRPTEALYPPTVIPVPNLAGAALTLGDLPADFREMPADRQEALGLAPETLASAFDLAQGRLRLLRAFDHPRTEELLVSFFVYPLTPEEQEALDRGLAGANAGLPGLWSTLSRYGWGAPSRVASLDRIGERGVWLTSVGSADAKGFALEVFIARRGPVLEFVLLGAAEGTAPAVELAAPIRLLDARVAALVAPTRQFHLTPAPTNRPADLTGVVLRKEDLPAGFVALAEGEWSAITGAETLSNTQRFSAARRQNEVVFMAPSAGAPLYVLGWLHYPLTEMEAGLLRKSLAYASPATGAALLGIPANNWRSASLLPGLAGVGETATGFTGLDNRTRPATRVQVVLVYRGGALITLLASYAEGTATDLDMVDVARALDGRLKAALP